MSPHYEINYFEVEDGVYWTLTRDGIRINGGVSRDASWAELEADHRMRYDRDLQWAIEKGYTRPA